LSPEISLLAPRSPVVEVTWNGNVEQLRWCMCVCRVIVESVGESLGSLHRCSTSPSCYLSVIKTSIKRPFLSKPSLKSKQVVWSAVKKLLLNAGSRIKATHISTKRRRFEVRVLINVRGGELDGGVY